RAHALGDPVLARVEHVPLVALDRRQAVAVLRHAARARRVALGALWLCRQAAEVVEEMPDRVGRRDEVRVEDEHVLGARVHPTERLLQGAALEALAALAVEDADARVVIPAL